MKKVLLYALVALSLASCSSTKVATRAEQYPLMYEEKPMSIVIMPPINRTTHAEAKDYFFSTMYGPLCEKGYYVFSPFMTLEMFQQESAYDAELFLEKDLSTFRTVLGADAAMFTIIKDWRRNNLGGKLSVQVEYILRSTKTGQTLYTREGDVSVDLSVNSGSSSLFSLIATVVSTAATDKIIAGRRCNAYVLSDLPCGKYSPYYEKDATSAAGSQKFKATVK